MDAQTGFARAIAEAARTRNERRSLENTLQTIVEVACNSVPGFEQVGIETLRKDGTVETKAATGDLVRNLTPPHPTSGAGVVVCSTIGSVPFGVTGDRSSRCSGAVPLMTIVCPRPLCDISPACVRGTTHRIKTCR
jgi:hypothetical protein